MQVMISHPHGLEATTSRTGDSIAISDSDCDLHSSAIGLMASDGCVTIRPNDGMRLRRGHRTHIKSVGNASRRLLKRNSNAIEEEILVPASVPALG